MERILRKCLSLADAEALRIDRHPHDYRHHGNRELALASGSSTVRLQVSWHDVPALSSPALRSLDRQIAAANDDGLGVVLALDEGPTGPPSDRSPSGPWASVLEEVFARYSGDGHSITALEILDEPNRRWPQEGAHVAVAEMMRTAADVAAGWDGPAILAPSLSDLPEQWLHGPYGPGTPLGVFMRRLLRELDGWTPRAYVGWSQHNYGDLARGDIAGVLEAVGLLGNHGWHDHSCGIWLTEGAVATPDPAHYTVEDAYDHEQLQADLLKANYDVIASLDEVRLWTYHSIHDLPGRQAKTGLRQDFDLARRVPGPEKLAWDRFVELPGDYGLAVEYDDDVPGEIALPAA